MATGIPAAVRLAGFVPGVILLLVVAVVTNYTVLLLIKDGLIAGKSSYQVSGCVYDVMSGHVMVM